MPMQL